MLQTSSSLKWSVSSRICKGKSFKPDPASNEAFLKGSGKQDASNQLQPQMKRFFNAHAKLICIEFISNYFLHNLVPAQKPYARTNCVNINEYVFFTIYEFIYSMIGTRRHSTQYSDLLLQASGMPSRPYSSRARGWLIDPVLPMYIYIYIYIYPQTLPFARNS